MFDSEFATEVATTDKNATPPMALINRFSQELEDLGLPEMAPTIDIFRARVASRNSEHMDDLPVWDMELQIYKKIIEERCSRCQQYLFYRNKMKVLMVFNNLILNHILNQPAIENLYTTQFDGSPDPGVTRIELMERAIMYDLYFEVLERLCFDENVELLYFTQYLSLFSAVKRDAMNVFRYIYRMKVPGRRRGTEELIVWYLFHGKNLTDPNFIELLRYYNGEFDEYTLALRSNTSIEAVRNWIILNLRNVRRDLPYNVRKWLKRQYTERGIIALRQIDQNNEAKKNYRRIHQHRRSAKPVLQLVPN